jgi:hypothetical protein
MKKRVIRISLAISVVLGILFGLLTALMRDGEQEMSFGFLAGRTLAVPIQQNTNRSFDSTTNKVYSFMADFNDVCAKADAELFAMGFKIAPLGFRPRSCRVYRLGDFASANTWMRVYIHEDMEITEAPDGLLRHRPAEGWISIEVCRSRLRSWPPKYLLYRLKLMWYRSANRPPVPNKTSRGK